MPSPPPVAAPLPKGEGERGAQYDDCISNTLSLRESWHGAAVTERAERVTMEIPKNNKLLKNARRLRKEMTPQELRLWYRFLRYYPVKIYKQRIIGDYIVDFYCASAKLVIEIDGSQHYDDAGKAHDAQRTAFLESLGLHVNRYSNREINCNFEAVCEHIDRIIQTLSAAKGGTSPRGRG